MIKCISRMYNDDGEIRNRSFLLNRLKNLPDHSFKDTQTVTTIDHWLDDIVEKLSEDWIDSTNRYITFELIKDAQEFENKFKEHIL